MAAYYNEFDSYAAQWLRNLIAAGRIAPGDVDERSIEDVLPDDLQGYEQCHFFAGIGVWSHALRAAGWDDDRPVWTGSCPCQPFSAAGKGGGFADERHLWPAFHWLLQQRRPAIVFGEQVAAKAVDDWIDLVSTDLEELGYAVGAVAFPSAGVGAPHVRDRTFWVADASGERRIGREGVPGGRLDDGAHAGWREGDNGAVGIDEAGFSRAEAAGPTNGFWRDADWLRCRDGNWRPVEPGTFPLVNGAAARVVCTCTRCKNETVIYEGVQTLRKTGVRNEGLASGHVCEKEMGGSRIGRLRAYGNAINAKAAQAFIEVAMGYRP